MFSDFLDQAPQAPRSLSHRGGMLSSVQHGIPWAKCWRRHPGILSGQNGRLDTQVAIAQNKTISFLSALVWTRYFMCVFQSINHDNFYQLDSNFVFFGWLATLLHVLKILVPGCPWFIYTNVPSNHCLRQATHFVGHPPGTGARAMIAAPQKATLARAKKKCDQEKCCLWVPPMFFHFLVRIKKWL